MIQPMRKPLSANAFDKSPTIVALAKPRRRGHSRAVINWGVYLVADQTNPAFCRKVMERFHRLIIDNAARRIMR